VHRRSSDIAEFARSLYQSSWRQLPPFATAKQIKT
jgi:hypothetical protein